MTTQSEYTFMVHSTRMAIPPTIVKVAASSIENSLEKMWELHKYKEYSLTHIDGEKYLPENEDYAPSLPDSVEHYWNNGATYAKRFSY